MNRTVVIGILGLGLMAAVVGWMRWNGDQSPVPGDVATPPSAAQETAPTPGQVIPGSRAPRSEGGQQAPREIIRPDPAAIEALHNTLSQLEQAVQDAPDEVTRQVLERKREIVRRSLEKAQSADPR